MHFFYKIIIKILFILSFFFIFACGDNGNSKMSRGHRDAIKFECESSANEKICGLEAIENFLKEDREFATFEELNKDQEKIAKIECVRAKKFGLISYNTCLERLIASCLDGKCAPPLIEPPDSNIAKLEKSAVRISIFEGKKNRFKKNQNFQEMNSIVFGPTRRCCFALQMILHLLSLRFLMKNDPLESICRSLGLIFVL